MPWTPSERARCVVRTRRVAAVTFTTMASMLVSTGGSAGGIPTGGTKVDGGTVRWAEPPSTPPVYIFPFMSPQEQQREPTSASSNT